MFSKLNPFRGLDDTEIGAVTAVKPFFVAFIAKDPGFVARQLKNPTSVMMPEASTGSGVDWPTNSKLLFEAHSPKLPYWSLAQAYVLNVRLKLGPSG